MDYTDAKLKPNQCYVSEHGEKPQDVWDKCEDLKNSVHKIKHGERGLGFLKLLRNLC